MAQSQANKIDDTTLELPRITKDPALSHLREAEEEYVILKKERAEQAAQLRASRAQIATARSDIHPGGWPCHQRSRKQAPRQRA